MVVVFALTAHLPDDERVWFQQVPALQKAGHRISVLSTRTGADIKAMCLTDVVICDTPRAVITTAVARLKPQDSSRKTEAARLKPQDGSRNGRICKQRTHIIYDVTEWYPSKKNLRGLPFYRKIFKFLLLTGMSLSAPFLVSGFIFGEYYKALPFRYLFFWKKYIYLPYYAHTQSIKYYPIRDISRKCTLLYAGRLTREKGFYTVLNTVAECAQLMPDTHFTLHIISDDKLPSVNPAGFTIRRVPLLPFPDFCAEIGKADICMDLRTADWENNRCLPIKIFYYLAAGRPVIYSNLKAIRKEIPEIESVGVLVNTQKDAVHAITDYTTCYKKY